jgi:hypothetical protein
MSFSASSALIKAIMGIICLWGVIMEGDLDLAHVSISLTSDKPSQT